MSDKSGQESTMRSCFLLKNIMYSKPYNKNINERNTKSSVEKELKFLLNINIPNNNSNSYTFLSEFNNSNSYAILPEFAERRELKCVLFRIGSK